MPEPCRRQQKWLLERLQAINTWRKRFGASSVDDVRRLKQLETENARPKKLVAERDLEIEVMKKINAKKW
jgi:putative transposase